MTPMLFDIGGGELLAIVLLAVLLFGPDKVPDLVKKAGRIIAYLRGIANSATDTLKTQLGPEFADMTPADLQPKRLLERTVLGGVKADIDGIKAQVDDLKKDLVSQLDPITSDLNATAASARSEIDDLKESLRSAGLKDLPLKDFAASLDHRAATTSAVANPAPADAVPPAATVSADQAPDVVVPAEPDATVSQAA